MKISKTRRPLMAMLLFSGLIVLVVLIMQPISLIHFGSLIDVIFPTGLIAMEERNLLFIIQGLMLLVIIPVYVLTFIFSWKYSALNPKGKYDPHLVDSKFAECIWWGFPLIMTIIVCALTWIKTEELDPYKSIPSDKETVTIQAVALQWKWLFIYPDEKIASLNFLQIPQNIPVRFEITADAPMNSLWIPDLSGQIYAMPGMMTLLNVIGNKVGDARGSSSNISGSGFSGMHFIARTSTEEDYKKWVADAKSSPKSLNHDEYTELVKPTSNVAPEIYQLADSALFNQIIDKYLHP